MKRLSVLLVVWCSSAAWADSVMLKNGDKLSGKVTAIDDRTITLDSAALGKVTLRRELVKSISLGEPEEADKAADKPADKTAPKIPATLDPKVLAEVQKLVPGLADPAAKELFDKMVKDMASGDLNVQGLRREAMHVLNELEQFEKELGPGSVAGMKALVGPLQKLVDTVPDDGRYTLADFNRVGEMTCRLKPGVTGEQVDKLIRLLEGGVPRMTVTHRDPELKFLSVVWVDKIPAKRFADLEKQEHVERLEPAFKGRNAYRHTVR